MQNLKHPICVFGLNKHYAFNYSYVNMLLPKMETTEMNKEEECTILKQALKIIDDYKGNYDSGANAPKLDRYVEQKDFDDPFVRLKQKLPVATFVLDTLFTIKKSRLLGFD